MEAKNMKTMGLLVQFIGLVILILGLNGFFIFTATVLYFPLLIVAIIVFVVCLFKGGAMHKRGKELEKQ
ncbi:MAG: hypothetical protein LLF28_06330 [Nitrospiraceae bacterium]|nr:hypothetical protein [Nitrospiraceae bacterium]